MLCVFLLINVSCIAMAEENASEEVEIKAAKIIAEAIQKQTFVMVLCSLMITFMISFAIFR